MAKCFECEMNDIYVSDLLSHPINVVLPISSHKAYIVKVSQNIHIEMSHTNC